MEKDLNTNKIYFFDTTLRDGQQTTGVDFSVEDKVKISNALDELGIDYIVVKRENGVEIRQSKDGTRRAYKVTDPNAPDINATPRMG